MDEHDHFMNRARSLNLQRTEYSIRAFLDGDEDNIIKLFNECYGGLAGYCLRTPEYWRWACLERPDVERKGVMVALHPTNKLMVGYVVAGKSGNIWELGYKKNGDERAIAQVLLEAALEYLTANGASEVKLQVPAEDHAVKDASIELGFSMARPTDAHVSVLDFKALTSLLASRASRGFKTAVGLARIRLTDAPSWVNPEFTIGNPKDIKEGNGKKTRILAETDVSTFSSMLLGRSSPFSMWLRGRVKVRPFWRIRAFAKLVSAISLKEKWFIPLSDFG